MIFPVIIGMLILLMLHNIFSDFGLQPISSSFLIDGFTDNNYFKFILGYKLLTSSIMLNFSSGLII
ncbi:hypothetical protein BCR36DRAFT_441911, partial [Piromyces finnis]